MESAVILGEYCEVKQEPQEDVKLNFELPLQPVKIKEETPSKSIEDPVFSEDCVQIKKEAGEDQKYNVQDLHHSINIKEEDMELETQQKFNVKLIGKPANVHPLHRHRKRQRNPSTWKQAVAKKLRNSGQTYTNRGGMNVDGKKFKNLDCSCKKKCIEVISEEERSAIFKSFWKMGEFGKQNSYLCGLIHQLPIKQKRPRDGSKNEKSCSYVYHLQKHGGTIIKVCKKFFLDTFGMTSDGRISRALQKIRNEMDPGDLRGKHPSATKISDGHRRTVIDHINKCLAYRSSDTRTGNPELNIKTMYELYKSEIAVEQNFKPVKEYYYRNIFNTEFNLHTP